MKLQIQNYCNCGKSFLYPEPLFSEAKNLTQLKKDQKIKSLIKLMKQCHCCEKKDKLRIEAYDTLTEISYIIYERKDLK